MYKFMTHYGPNPFQAEAIHPGDSGQVGDGRLQWLNFSSGDYLGLSRHRALRLRAISVMQQYGTGMGAPRGLGGNWDLFNAIEDQFATALRRPSGMLWPDAWPNIGPVVNAIIGQLPANLPSEIWAEDRCHPGLLRALHKGGVPVKNFSTAAQTLGQELANHAAKKNIILFSETCFSTTGQILDTAALAALAQMAQNYQARLILDDTQAFGVLGAGGLGLAADIAADGVIIGLGLAAAAGGTLLLAAESHKDAFCHNPHWHDATPLPVPVWGLAQAALELIPAMAVERASLQAKIGYLHSGMRGLGMAALDRPSHIFPIHPPQGRAAKNLSQALRQAGIGALYDSALPHLRLLLTAFHTPAQLDEVLAAGKNLGLFQNRREQAA